MKDRVALIVAVGAVVGLAVGVIYMASVADKPNSELVWTRLQYLFGAIEALAFAGTGWLWGKEVHRQQAANAEARAQQAEQQKDAAVASQKDLKTFADAVVSQVDAITKAQADAGADMTARFSASRASLEGLANLARKYQ